MQALFSSLALADVHQDVTRNIVSLRVSSHLFDDLSDDPAAWSSAQQLELVTKSQLFISNQPIIDRPFEEAEWNDAIGYPFQNAAQSRYSDGSFGVWYGADSIETSIHETVYHWQKGLLEDAGFNRPGVEIQRRVYLVQCDSLLIDLRPCIGNYPEITHSSDYTTTHQIGSKLHREGHPGLITPSARSTGDVFAIFAPKILSNPRHLCYLSYTTTAHGVEIQRTPGEVWMTV